MMTRIDHDNRRIPRKARLSGSDLSHHLGSAARSAHCRAVRFGLLCWSLALLGLCVRPALVLGADPERATEALAPAFTPKLTAPIDIEYRFDAEPQNGMALVVTLTVTAGEPLADAQLTLRADDALTIIDPLTRVDLGAVAAGETVAIEATVLPLEAKTHYLRVAVAAEIRGQQQSRNIAVPIRVDSAAPRKTESQTTGKTEQSVRSFRAVETVR